MLEWELEPIINTQLSHRAAQRDTTRTYRVILHEPILRGDIKPYWIALRVYPDGGEVLLLPKGHRATYKTERSAKKACEEDAK